MDLARADAMLIYEDRERELESPTHIEGSEDEDAQQELEEMLYSRVYHESSSTDLPPPVPENCPILNVNITSVDDSVAKVGFKAAELSITSPAPQSSKNCNRSQFNHPSRTTPSRYYDVNQEVHNSKPTFVAPTNPSRNSNSKKVMKRKQSNTPSGLSNKLLARSSNEESYLPKPTPVVRSSTSPPLNVSKDEELSSQITQQNESESAEPNAKQSPITTSPPSSKSAATENSQTETIPVTHVDQSEERIPKTSEGVQLQKDPQFTPSRVSQKSKLPTFEAKVSKVLSSMLDEESRSSVEETQLTSLSSAQELNSGWSVGMSWADMSSKYSFGVDSIEEESVSSLQLHDTSFISDSRTNTPDAQTQHIINDEDNNVNEQESEEPSIYSMQLKDHRDHKDQESHVNTCDTDSESEVGSIVEIAPPVKPTPVLVDISDGEYAPTNDSSQVVENVIDSSSDDDVVVINVIDSSKTKNTSPQKGHKRQSNTQIDSHPEDVTPLKRSSYHEDIIVEEENLVDDQKSQQKSLLPDVVSGKKRNRLDRWLHNPIKASKYLDHQKYLGKMSDNPSLWQLCRADITKMQSPRGPKCVNCNEFGHKTHLCRLPRKIISCHMCGQPGHSETRCKEKMCLRCGKKNTIFTDRCKSCTSNSILCKICKARTHTWKTCPDLWRRYHLTTSVGDITQPTAGDDRPRSEHWCSNCAKRGHLSHECYLPHWKCESISPFIKSYSNVCVEETKFEGSQSFSLMLTDEAASLLNTEEGKELLKSLSVQCQVEIHTSFDITYKKLSMKGSTLAIEEVRSRVMNWTSPKEVSSRNASLPHMIASETPNQTESEASTKNASTVSANIACESSTNKIGESAIKNASENEASIKNSEATNNSASEASTDNLSLPAGAPSNQIAETQGEADLLYNTENLEESSTSSETPFETTPTTKQKSYKGKATGEVSNSDHAGMTICDAWNLPPSLPKQYSPLQSLLENEMKFIDSPIYCNETVKQLYQKFVKCAKGTSSSKRKDARHYSRILSIILLGKCGFCDGSDHVAALKRLIQSLKERKGAIGNLYKQVLKHYAPIFQGILRYDYKALVRQFYLDETLVKMFDSKTDGASDSNEEAKNASSLEKISIDKPEINLLTPKKKPTKKLPRMPLHSSNKLKAAEKRIKKIVPFVVKNLTSRFIFSHDRTSLERMYASFCKQKACKKEEIIADMNQVIEKLCKCYNIKLPTK
ncbi:uncharacterized protein LOC117640861 [Thrips palmi]|uniref:Zinc finger CCHC domain-containing protein 7 n=1 Tax=Thrips palmi TaxID=161013 RepID=A0A6P8YAD0_THRPL|nr:uncharacterized protein LOC117640861 [Thrips palmi]